MGSARAYLYRRCILILYILLSLVYAIRYFYNCIFFSLIDIVLGFISLYPLIFHLVQDPFNRYYLEVGLFCLPQRWGGETVSNSYHSMVKRDYLANVRRYTYKISLYPR